jgi:hypothetical protein
LSFAQQEWKQLMPEIAADDGATKAAQDRPKLQMTRGPKSGMKKRFLFFWMKQFQLNFTAET